MDKFVNVRIEDDLRDELKRIAEEEHRTVSNLVRYIIIQWLKGNGRERL